MRSSRRSRRSSNTSKTLVSVIFLNHHGFVM
jgi:hypothetical protein